MARAPPVRATSLQVLQPAHRLLLWRVQALGTQIAQIGCDLDGPAEEGESGYGPLRAWPGGLCVSRAIGDIDVGSCILAHPHIVQLEVPSDGARLALASDGVSCCVVRACWADAGWPNREANGCALQ